MQDEIDVDEVANLDFEDIDVELFDSIKNLFSFIFILPHDLVKQKKLICNLWSLEELSLILK